MIQSTGNNFGCGHIQFNDFQNEDIVILNGKFSFSPANEDYKTAEVLEISLPDLSIPKSSPGFAYIATSYSSYSVEYNPCTVLKSWIKDKNTLCIEKLPIYDKYESLTIWIFSLYATLGKCGTPVAFEKTNIKYIVTSIELRPSNLVCVVQPEWCFFHFYTSSYLWVKDGEQIIAELENFPKDIDVEFPFIGGNLPNGIPGANSCIATIKDGIFTIAKPAFGISSTGQEPFLCIYIVRN